MIGFSSEAIFKSSSKGSRRKIEGTTLSGGRFFHHQVTTYRQFLQVQLLPQLQFS